MEGKTLTNIEEADSEIMKYAHEVKMWAEHLGDTILGYLHYISPTKLAKIKERLRSFDEVNLQWKDQDE